MGSRKSSVKASKPRPRGLGFRSRHLEGFSLQMRCIPLRSAWHSPAAMDNGGLTPEAQFSSETRKV